MTEAAVDAGESALYEPIKAFLEAQGYEVKGEVENCDVVGRRGDEAPVIVELKQRLSLELIVQGVERQRLSHHVYLAFPVPKKRSHTVWNKKHRSVMSLCRRLGLGVLLVHQPKKRCHWVEPRLDPGPYKPRPDTRGRGRLLREFHQRVGDPNTGGINKRQVMTAYRQGALLCAHQLRDGPLQLADVREGTAVTEASRLMQRNVYGWFDRVARGVYAVSPKGREALAEYADMIAQLTTASPAAALPIPDASNGSGRGRAGRSRRPTQVPGRR